LTNLPAFLALAQMPFRPSESTPSSVHASLALKTSFCERASSHSRPNFSLNIGFGTFRASGFRMVALDAMA